MARRVRKRYNPPPKMPIRKGDIVRVMLGRDAAHGGEKAKEGRVLRVFPQTGYAVVEGVRLVTRHKKANPQQGIKGGRLEMESPIHHSNLKLVRRETKA